MKKIADFIVDKRKCVMILYLFILVISAVGMLYVNVNYDMSKYLPKDSSTKLGMEKMSSEYGDLASITVMFDGLDEPEQLRLKEDLASITNVKSVVYLQDNEAYQKDGHSKYVVAVSASTYSKEAREVLDEIKDRYQDYDISVSGAVVDNDLLVRTLADEIPIIAIIVVMIIFIILFLLCDSWIEPFLYMGCIGVAILINMGTNALLPSVSFMTFAVGALLQLGLSMDYSIMLMNRYSQEKLDDPTPAAAMKRALRHAFGAITSSSVTTIVGLLVLVFMSFKIGQDMGIVLAKGVFISLICIFTVLPGLVIMFDKLIMKTHKKSLNFKMDVVMKVVTKARFALIPIVAVIVVLAVMLKGGLGIGYVKTFDNEDQKKIEDVFGVDNQVVLLYGHAEEGEKIAEYISWLEGQEEVNSVQDYTNTIGKEYTYKELAEDMGMTESQAKMLYQMHRDSKDDSAYEKITMYDLICFLAEQVATNPDYAEFMTEEQIAQIQVTKQQLDAGKQLFEVGNMDLGQGVEMYEKPLTAEELAYVMGEDVSAVEEMLKIRRMSMINVENDRMKLEEFVGFITEEVLANETYAAAITDDMRKELEEGQREIKENKELMFSDGYNRMMVSLALPLEGDETFKFIGKMEEKAEDIFSDETWLVGDSTMGYEMDLGFSDELNFVTILTVVAILAVVVVTFRSIVCSAALVAVIQAAVYIVTAIAAMMDISVNYIALILVQCILMGSTIDYGILFISNYREMRQKKDKKEAVVLAMNYSIKTILTSSMILISCCLTVGFIMTQEIIAQTCSVIAYGALCAVILVIFLLPALTYILDRFVVKRERKVR